MLIEQAFFALPEVLVGLPFREQEYEAGIVSAFTLALFQELNGRNVANPLSLLSAERLYSARGYGGAEARNLRADLFADLYSLRIGSRRLERYGFRLSNWIEAKFFRDRVVGRGERTTNANRNTRLLVADLIRLATLPPREVVMDKVYTGRYLLHVYDDEPGLRLSRERNSDGGRTEREWVTKTTVPGSHEVAEFRVGDDRAIAEEIGAGLVDLRCSFGVTNFVLSPTTVEDQRHRLFWCVLTRLETIRISIGAKHWTLHGDRRLVEGGPGDYLAVRDLVGEGIHRATEEDEDEPPDPDAVREAERVEATQARRSNTGQDPYLDVDDSPPS